MKIKCLLPFSCWLRKDIFFYVTVVAFVLLILLCNITVFVVVLIQIRQMRANKPSAKGHNSLQDLKAVASLTVLLGLTWAMGFLSFGPGRVVLIYMFTIFNTLQGKHELLLVLQLSVIKCKVFTFIWHFKNLQPLPSLLFYPRSLCFCVSLLDEGKREETVEDPFMLWTFPTQWSLR